jgi:hypothetical protein
VVGEVGGEEVGFDGAHCFSFVFFLGGWLRGDGGDWHFRLVIC